MKTHQLTKKQIDKLFEVARHNNAEFPSLVTLNVGGDTFQVTLYENGKYRIHQEERKLESST